MKSELSRVKRIFTIAAAFLFCLCLSSSAVDAQTSKRRTRRTLQPIVVPTPFPQGGEPVVISRAADQQNENQIFVQPQPAPQNQAETSENSDDGMNDLKARVKSLESKNANEYDQKQKRLLLNLDILTRAETRSESLRKQLFDMIEKESTVKTRLEQIENDSRPEMIDRSAAFAGSLRPEEIRDARRKNMASEKVNLQNLLTEIQNSRTSLETNLQKSDALVEKLRFKLEKDIDDALTDEPKN
ncbi:MAG: hypothetical protein M3525_14520 [Acidobacteriota bacterium]|nr:hypothetical protein [Acidobacteriota bacterium]